MKKNIMLLILVLLLLAPTTPGFAQDGGGDGGDNVPMSQVLTNDGSIDFTNMTDNGVVNESVSWMPTIPFLGQVQAQYHQYTTPDGATVKVPTASTLFFMAANPAESGLYNNSGSVATGHGLMITGYGTMVGKLMGNVPALNAGNGSVQQLSDEYVAADAFADTLRAGGDGWTGGGDMWNTLGNLIHLIGQDAAGGDITHTGYYTTILIYEGKDNHTKVGGNTQAAAAAGPDGASPKWDPKCPSGVCLLEKYTYPPIPKPEIPECQAPHAQIGGIHANAEKIDPKYPLVVGQDPNNRGVDVKYTVSVDPINYYWETLEVVGHEEVCVCPVEDPACSAAAAQCEEVEIYACVPHHKLICEPLQFASGTASLAQSSRDWINYELSLWYPYASVRRPDWEFGGGQGSCSDGQVYTWELIEKYVPLEDPGYYDQAVWGRTDDTPVSVGRFFSLSSLNQFSVEFIDTTIIQ
jgi:hypothetical protein